jgi:quercetin dioxygenase-like cupin family protein
LFIMKLVARDTGNQFSIAEYHVPVGGGPPLHVHTREDETFWVLEGSVTFQVGGKALAAPAGTTVFAPRGVPHTFRNVSGSPARMLVLVSPAQNFEDFYAAIARPNADGSPPTEQQSIERIGVEAPRYGLTILGPNPL